MKQNFIKTSDSETASKMMNLGFQKIDEQNGIYTFLNTDKLMFSDDIDKSKIQYSNMLTFSHSPILSGFIYAQIFKKGEENG